MSAHQSFAALLGQLAVGDQEAASHVFRQFGQRLVRLAASRLQTLIKHKAGPEDIVQSVFRSFFLGQRAGHFDLRSWDGLWDLLVVITLRKCCNRVEYFQAACRDVRREAAGPWGVKRLNNREPAPLEALQLAETVEHLLGQWQPRERAIVELRLQGYEVHEISEHLGCTERKVYRVLERVKQELHRLRDESGAA